MIRVLYKDFLAGMRSRQQMVGVRCQIRDRSMEEDQGKLGYAIANGIV
jgi:hypothetical protein